MIGRWLSGKKCIRIVFSHEYYHGLLDSQNNIVQGETTTMRLEGEPKGDVRLIVETLAENKLYTALSVVPDGVEALAYLRREGHHANAPRPDLILLDLNLPRMDGREVLAEIKEDESLRRIPVVVLTTSEQDKDVIQSYDQHANCYITKPLDFEHSQMRPEEQEQPFGCRVNPAAPGAEKLEDGQVVEVKGNEEIEYDGTSHTYGPTSGGMNLTE